MNLDQLTALSKDNEARIDDHEGYSRTPPFYFDSLRHAFGFYFNTFLSQNSSYEVYAEGPFKGFSPREFLDEENSAMTIISLERFFELFLKHVLLRINPLLIREGLGKNVKIQDVLNQIGTGSISESRNTISFSDTLNRFYGLIEYSNIDVPPDHHLIIPSFAEILGEYKFLCSIEHRSSLEFLNRWRNRILHNGNTLPSPWLLDYMVTQLWIPVIFEIIKVERPKLTDSLFYLETITNFKILEELTAIKFEFADWSAQPREMFSKHLYIGHIKELGRANLNMNLFVRNNYAGYEYNYRDPKGRGKRFANAERDHPHFKEVKSCPCCGERSLVLYRESIDDVIFNPGHIKNIDWVKCYTCDYHLRCNVGDLSLFINDLDKLFELD